MHDGHVAEQGAYREAMKDSDEDVSDATGADEDRQAWRAGQPVSELIMTMNINLCKHRAVISALETPMPRFYCGQIPLSGGSLYGCNAD